MRNVEEILEKLFSGRNFNSFAKTEIKAAITEATAALVAERDQLKQRCEELEKAVQQAEGCSEIRPNETPGGYKRRLLEPLFQAMKETK